MKVPVEFMLDSVNTFGLNKEHVDALIQPNSNSSSDVNEIELVYAELHKRYITENPESVVLQIVPQLVSARPLNRWGLCPKVNCNAILLPYGMEAV